MKTLLYNPIFINPQAYYVFPNLSRVQTQEVDSTKEPANYIGTIEVKTIAYGDTNKVQTFTSTSEIDLVNFSNEWVRISLYTILGSVVLGEWKLGNFEQEEPEEPPYIAPDVLSSLCGVWIADQNTNESSTRNIIKNKLKDRGGDFEILNAAYKLNSGYGLYKEDFAGRWHLFEGVNASHNRISLTDSSLKNTLWIANRYNDKIYSYYVNIRGIPKNGTLVITNPWTILYNGLNKIETNGIESETLGFRILEDSINLDWSKLVIEQIPEHKGAFVTDGVDDLIVSEKTMKDMLNGSTEYTVISMTHQIAPNSAYNKFFTNYIHEDSGLNQYNRVDVDKSNSNKTGIYGYTSKGDGFNKQCPLGDKEDYYISRASSYTPSYKFSVEGFTNSNGYIYETSSVAWYWTVIANISLTEDQINQVIEYFNLDKYVKPDIYYNVKKQGITNDNHAQFGDKLIDYSGNGHDMQLYNILWALDSGIGSYPVSFATRCTVSSLVDKSVIINQSYFKIINPIEKDSIDDLEIQHTGYQTLVYANAGIPGKFKLKITGLPKNGKFRINPDNYGQDNVIIVEENGIYEVTNFNGIFAIYKPNEMDYTGLKVELVPEHKGALVLDGVDDFGKVEELPILKDYTVVVDREILNKDKGTVGSVLSKSKRNSSDGIEYGAFIFEMTVNNYSFNYFPTNIGNDNYNKTRTFSYLSKYLYNGKTVNVGTATDSNSMWLGTIRDNDPRFSNLAFYSAMLFPYSLSKFLIKRQLKKHKLGSFYEDMVQFRPEISTNVPYDKIEYFNENWELISIGDYLPVGSTININITLSGSGDEISSITPNQGTVLKVEQSGTIKPNIWDIRISSITKSILKLDITIDEYIRFEDIVQPYPLLISFENKTWGDKLKVGEFYIFYAYNIFTQTSNKDIYNFGKLYFNGIEKEWHYDGVVISKSNVFTCEYEYVLDSNEPKCILSPELLKMPNESYQYLGYIPDISGHGNNGVFVNTSLDSELSGPQSNGSWKLDGVDDFIVLNDLSIGGRQMFMKFSFGNVSLAYDQRNEGINNFAMIVGNNSIAHNSLNNSGNTYIDGILNKNILSNQLQNIIHNVTLTNDIDIEVVSQTPVIGSNAKATNDFSKISLYTFMLFDGISSPEKIKELNEIIGINPIVETPPYYYDTNGRSNLDENKVTMDNLGTGGVHPLVAQNIAFESMSGYGGYTFPNFSKWSVTGGNIGIDVDTETPYHVDITNMDESNQWDWCRYISEGQFTVGGSGKAIFKCDKNIGFIIDLKYRKAGDTVDNTAKFFEQQVKANTPTEITWTYKTQEELDALGAVSHWYLVYFWLVKDVTYSIDMLPEYPNALVLDGVNDTLRNTTIPALTDFTCIVKRKAIGEQANNSIFMFKGVTPTAGGKSNAFLYDYKSAGINNVFSFGQANGGATKSTISYITKTSCDGRTIIPGNGVDTVGLMIGKWDTWRKMAFYKMMLYPKTLDILQINMLKNLFELDEKIDINNPIFKEPERGG